MKHGAGRRTMPSAALCLVCLFVLGAANCSSAGGTKASSPHGLTVNGITVASPGDRTSASLQFSITGTAPAPMAGTFESINVVIDGQRDWSLTRDSYKHSSVGPSGRFDANLDLVGSRVLENRTAVSGGYQNAYRALLPRLAHLHGRPVEDRHGANVDRIHRRTHTETRRSVKVAGEPASSQSTSAGVGAGS